MLQVAEELESYRLDFERLERADADRRPQWIGRIRTAAFDRFVELGFPTTRLEEWKYTNVAPIAKIPFRRAGQAQGMLPIAPIGPFTLEDVACAQLVFVNGCYSADLSSLKELPAGVVVGSLATALAYSPASVEQYLAQHAGFDNQAFVALNTAFMEDGAFVSIPNDTIVEAPIHLLFISSLPFDSAQDSPFESTDDESGSATVSYPRNLIVVGAHSQARIVESYVSAKNGVYCTNAVTEIIGGENAAIDYYKVQRESEEAFHVATVHAQLSRSGTFSSHAIDLGGALVRNNLDVALDGEGAECALDGLYMVTGRQHVDHHTRIDHVQPHCNSRQLYKGILDGKSRGVFNGKVVVHKAAEKTDARQVNKNLLLSEDAVIDSKPQLEIFNNDVKCTHGTTIGQHDQDAMFYLRSRGIDPAAARSLLTYAFASELLSRITIGPIRAGLEALLVARLGNDSTPEERS
ncbi:sufD, needed for fhuF Fe-S center production/stability [Candidatus Methylomirabilis lanthanidiphila]|uniref:SufD, needed for fhuF Fe-S center production/stability n=1 Tax=Candidatus Methylomirabilis lanthanidiphila TaxID=2211376 RepID=A0A564ZPF2_9BACT|nr:Fe-S cluster assembly protein SufD [Candidatus Methylomirabilis lanthanidiphila]VUZ86532.1 sufD, needed for fhuF Fe-S center production/stability [Candidatus Methylomirabilis lanthanidiphila]